ncbi:MAG TPA: arginine deiminase family protein [Thermoanaerobaculia bacterium]|nr:arginine deiminase family protein [Thermoanaerobaculia bacterium]
MRLNVTSEIGKLKSVLMHLPGREIDVMIPSMMEQLLFDDILYGQLAREEHRRFQQMMWYVAEEVHDLQDLLEEVFEESDLRQIIVEDFCNRNGLKPALRELLASLAPDTLAETLAGGIVVEDQGNSHLPVFDLPPVPNLFFMRDPQVVIGDGVAISSMATEARQRESLLSRYVFRYHKAFRGRDLFWMDLYDQPWPKTAAAVKRRPTIEGGDVLVAGRDLLLVGLSERTNRAGIEHLARSLKASDAGVKTILVVEIPRQRSFMHLDTVFTIINRDECMIYPPVILPGGTDEAKVYELDLGRRELTYTSRKSLLGTLKRKGLDLKPIFCGGRRTIDQQREQWTDGANAFTLAPGVILLYERNIQTAAELDRHGYTIVYEDDLLLGRTELELWDEKKYAIQIQGHELSRARGGPRCMTMPLEREDV